MSDYTDEEKLAFKRDIERAHRAARKIPTTLQCVTCGFEVDESIAKQKGYRACPACGDTNVIVKGLEYNPSVAPNPLPSPQEAEMQSRMQRPGRIG